MNTATSIDVITLSDEQLLLEYRATGNAIPFDELVRRYERKLYAFLHHFLQDPEMAEDAFQATFLQLHVKCDQFEAGRRLSPWLYQMAKNQAIDLARRTRRHRLPSLDDPGWVDNSAGARAGVFADNKTPGPCERLDGMEEQARLRAAAEKLPQPLGQIVKLVYFEGLKYREAAEALSIPVGTLKSRMHRALGMLREQLPARVGSAA